MTHSDPKRGRVCDPHPLVRPLVRRHVRTLSDLPPGLSADKRADKPEDTGIGDAE